MFQCRICAENPFNTLFGGQAPAKGEKDSKKKKEKAGAVAGSAGRRSVSQRDEVAFKVRTAKEVDALIAEWVQYTHPRAKDFFSDQEDMESVLREVAEGIDRCFDPILGSDDQCVYWYGNVTKDDLQAAIRMVKPGDNSESVTYVNRVLAFIFATDESFERLMKLPKEPFRMSCGDQLCVHLAHISLSV
eukprot:TRINITY_DN90339_c0_g1_i1.p2 TRINITY_DN90339_c0_g1~~TRINITY_DN90339_c0_g1_i1.p2  ORF type:complete len:189 (+),score=40.62 TRINITY_DN90339_c0_g1_i1:86-652(+)